MTPGGSVRELDPYVLALPEGDGLVTAQQLDEIERRALENDRGRCRILLHGEPSDSLHEMVIAVAGRPYIAPHINRRSAKSFLVLRGEMLVILFEPDGQLAGHRSLAAGDGERAFMLRLGTPRFHTIVPVTTSVVFIETAAGAHEATPYADWAPAADGSADAQAYWAGVLTAVGLG